MTLDPTMAIRLARPSRDLAAAERFYVTGLGLTVLFRKDDLLMVGFPGASWHLELVAGTPAPTSEDLLVLYLNAEVPGELVERLVANGGRRVSQTDYWDRWGVTIADGDGYRLVLSTRAWENTPA